MNITNYFNVRPALGDITNETQANRHKRLPLSDLKSEKNGAPFSPKRTRLDKNSFNQPKISEIFQPSFPKETLIKPPKIASDLLRSFLGDDITVEEFLYSCSKLDHPSLRLNSNPSYEVAEYIHQIIAFEKLREDREEFIITDFLSAKKHPKLDADMLAILADWIIEVQENFMLNHETLHLIWSLFLAYLENSTNIAGREIQLMTCAAIMVACKHEEHQMPQLEELQYITNYCYAKNDFLEAEKKLLKTINFSVHMPNAYIFLRRFARVLDVNDQHVQFMTRFLLECGMHSFPLSISRSSKRAAAVLWLSRIVLNNPSYRAWLKTKEICQLKYEIVNNPKAKEYYCSLRKNCDKTLTRSSSSASTASFVRENSINSSQSILSLSTDESMCSTSPNTSNDVLDPQLKHRIDEFRLDCNQKRPIWPQILTYITGYTEQEIVPVALLYHRVAMLLIAEVAKVSSEESLSNDSQLRGDENSNQSSSNTQSNSSSVDNQLKKSVVSKYCSKSFLCVANLYPQLSYENLVPKFTSLQCPESCPCFVCSHLISSQRRKKESQDPPTTPKPQ